MSSEDIQFDIDLPWDDFLDNSVLLYMSKMHSVSLRASAFKCLAAKVRDTEMKG